MSPTLGSPAIVTLLAPEPSRWESLRWLAGVDLRVLWATAAAIALFAVWGAWHGWRAR